MSDLINHYRNQSFGVKKPEDNKFMGDQSSPVLSKRKYPTTNQGKKDEWSAVVQ